jgi:5-oxoprolinase (ATP-hydrolysing) subunit C
MSLRVREAGLLSLLVDCGRPRTRHLGVPLGGAADRGALALGNALVGNAPDAVVIEVTLSGPILEALHPAACVVFGAPFQSAINDRAISAGTTFTLEPGDILRVGGTLTSARGYLCMAGGFEVAEVLGSRSGLEPLRAGDELRCRASRIEPRSLPFVGSASPPSPSSPRGKGGGRTLRVLDGPQRDWFGDDGFFEQDYAVSAASNRMGVRLTGAPLTRRAGELVSEAVAPGAVQITNDGLPVVLGVDGQTIGGYPKIAHVIRADLDRLAQLRPGDRVRFVRVTQEEAEHAARERALFLKDWLTRLRIADRQPAFVNVGHSLRE